MSSIKNSKDASFTEVCRTLYDVPNIRAMEVAKLYRRQVLEDTEYCSFGCTEIPSYHSMLDSFAQKALASLTECNLDGTYSLTLSELKAFIYSYPEKYNELCAGKEVLISAHLGGELSRSVNETRHVVSMKSLSLDDELFYWKDTIKSFRDDLYNFFIDSANPDKCFDFSRSLDTFTSLYLGVNIGANVSFNSISSLVDKCTDMEDLHFCHLYDSIYVLSLVLPEILPDRCISVDMSNIKVF